MISVHMDPYTQIGAKDAHFQTTFLSNLCWKNLIGIREDTMAFYFYFLSQSVFIDNIFHFYKVKLCLKVF